MAPPMRLCEMKPMPSVRRSGGMLTRLAQRRGTTKSFHTSTNSPTAATLVHGLAIRRSTVDCGMSFSSRK